MDKILNLLGLAKKAGRLEVGEEPTGAAARARDARLIVVAADAAENTTRRVRHFADAGQCLWVRIPAEKDQLGSALGRSSCAMAAITDIGFAQAVAEKLAEQDSQFAETAQRLAVKAERAAQRRKEAEQHEKNVRMGKKKSKEQPPVPQEKKSGKNEKSEKSAAPHRRDTSMKAREQRRREGAKRAAARRYEGSRPVKKGKGSEKK